MDRRTAIRTLAAATALPLVSPEDFASLLEARRSLDCGGQARPFVPAALSAQQLAMVRTVADIILPRTDTPGASDVGVHEFIDIIVSEWFDADEADRFLRGLSALDTVSSVRTGSVFLESEPEQQIALVGELDGRLADLREAGDERAGESFFHWMKRLTLTGYFTSEEGMAALQHRRIPGAFEGCLVPEPTR